RRCECQTRARRSNNGLATSRERLKSSVRAWSVSEGQKTSLMLQALTESSSSGSATIVFAYGARAWFNNPNHPDCVRRKCHAWIARKTACVSAVARRRPAGDGVHQRQGGKHVREEVQVPVQQGRFGRRG